MNILTNQHSKIQKIMIIGKPGSGKSTFALSLSKQLAIPLFHLDKYFFENNWVERNYQEFLSLQENMISSPSWIIDGNSTKSYELRYKNADLCLYFNFPRWLCYWRVFKRLIYKNPEIEDRALNCNETVRWSLLKYMWSFENRVSPILHELRTKYPNVTFIEFRSDLSLNQFLKSFICIPH